MVITGNSDILIRVLYPFHAELVSVSWKTKSCDCFNLKPLMIL